MEDPNDKSKRIGRLIIFTILMVGVLASVIALYKIARPFIEDPGLLNIVLAIAIILIGASYAMAIKTGIPPVPPKTREDFNPGINPANPSETPLSSTKTEIKSGIPPTTRTTIKSGIPPTTRKTDG